jgi:hypothetical protein
MGVGVLLWVAGKRFLIKLADAVPPSPITDLNIRSTSDVQVCINTYLRYFLWAEILRLNSLL